MARRPKEGGDSIRALGRGLEVLDLFAIGRTELSLTEVAELTDLPLPTVQRMLRTLEQHGYVRRTHDRGPFTLGPALLPLIPPLFASLSVIDIARPFIDELAARTDESPNLAVLEGAQVLYLVTSSGRRLLTPNTAPGMKLPAHCTALGKSLLAQLDDVAARAALGAEPYERRTDATLTTWSELGPELARIRDRGHSLSEGEYEEGLCACAVPVTTTWATPASINVAVPTSRWSRSYVEETIRPALEVARQGITAAFGAFAVEDPT